MREEQNQTSEKSFAIPIQQISLGSVVMMEHSAENYFEANIELIKALIEQGYTGVYLSFQRPYNNVASILMDHGIDIDKLHFVDIASALTGESQAQNDHVVMINKEVAIDDIVRAVYTSLEQQPAEKQFIFIDSLTTLTLYKSLSETMRFSEFLVQTVRKKETITLIFNVAADLAQKQFIQDIAFRVDQVIPVGLS